MDVGELIYWDNSLFLYPLLYSYFLPAMALIVQVS